MVFDESKIPKSVLCRLPKGTFIPSLVKCQKRRFFEEITLKIAKKHWKRAITPTWLNRLTQNLIMGRSHHAEHFYPLRIELNLMILEIYAKKLLSDPYVLFLLTIQKSPHQFYEGYPKEHSYQVGFQLVNWCQRRRVLKNF